MKCSYCRGRDHNRVSCPNRIERVNGLRKVLEEGGEITWNSSRLIGQDDKYKSRKGAKRKCSYCYNRKHEIENGHNRRNCPQLSEDKLEAYQANKEYRAIVLASLVEMGLGPGAIVDDNSQGRSVITEVSWNAVNFLNPRGHTPHRCGGYIFTIVPIKEMATGRAWGTSRALPEVEGVKNNYYSWHAVKVEVPATERLIRGSLPRGWKEGAVGIGFYFDRKYDKHC